MQAARQSVGNEDREGFIVNLDRLVVCRIDRLVICGPKGKHYVMLVQVRKRRVALITANYPANSMLHECIGNVSALHRGVKFASTSSITVPQSVFKLKCWCEL